MADEYLLTDSEAELVLADLLDQLARAAVQVIRGEEPRAWQPEATKYI